ncbi:YHYH protein [Salinibacterium sp. NK8237]|uniref:YHYH protein n=1 Tax=Salinibacterium sp. NK8237 TaxID=2792038 RepID=UPI0018CD5252|nr:YHYH protein [Salinibacterium sp. NK8237]MBH0130761.1 YHYH protein [Salinibacterium sp. NK8237]
MNTTVRRDIRLKRPPLFAGVLVLSALALAACASADTTTSTDDATTAVTAGLDLDLFVDGAIVDEATTVDCTLTGGTETTCYEITISGDPTDHDIGPFCPDTTSTSADDAGIWFDGDEVYDLDGEFIANLAETYGDDGWHMYDEDGNVYVTDTIEAFEAAARPDVDPAYQNYCIEGSFDFLENGEAIQTTVLIPTTPVLADESYTTQGNLGVTLDGVIIAASAPVDAILGAYTIAAFDDCGAHFNPFEGYHMHGATGCSEVGDAADGETAIFGYAMDGFAVHSAYTDDELADVELDECNGHTTDELGYHYHANSAADNMVIECFMGQTVAGDEEGAGGPPAGGAPDGGAPPEDAPDGANG